MKVMILGGAGIQGSAAARDLIEFREDVEITLADLDLDSIKPILEWLDDERVEGVALDAADEDDLRYLMEDRDFDVIISSVPWSVTLPPLDAAIRAGVDFVDFGLYQNREFDERFLEYGRRARDARVAVIPSCGVAPGLTNILAAYGASRLEQVDTVHIYVGGIPEHPEPPLQYKTVWSLEGVWTQFFESTRAIRGGRPVELDPCSELETLEIEGVGELEAALTDGLGTMLHMYDDSIFEGVSEVFEKTLRHPGHYDKMLTLKECGLLDDEPIRVDDTSVSPRSFLTTLLGPKLKMREGERDMTVMSVRVAGRARGEKRCFTYDMVDRADLATGVLSMGRTTGYTGSIVAGMLADDRLERRGMVEPERLGADPKLFEYMLRQYARRGIEIHESIIG
ncbi:MAG: saccharopine dehydrogenase family protein [Clostridia bacterium]